MTVNALTTEARRDEMTQDQIDDARAKAEIAIQKILLALEDETGVDIEDVNVDTRNFASLNVEIFMEGGSWA